MKIILGVTGGIAAYKSVILARELIKLGNELQVVLTPEALSFVTPLTFSVISKNPVLINSFDSNNGKWNNHIDLANWADIILIVPATINTIAKLANGICDNLLMSILFSARNRVIVCPAMDLEMHQHFTYQDNINKLQANGIEVLHPNSGELASGESGYGRVKEPFEIIEYLKPIQSFKGKKVLITAGPTIEHIDPVRYISNHSSGKMGYAIAENFANQGAEVFLVSGPVSIDLRNTSIQIIKINTAEEMLLECNKYFDEVDIALFSAAVADFKIKEPSTQKIKKTEGIDSISIEMVKNPDILKTLASKKENQFIVGFALESNNGRENALNKLVSKNCDMICLNSLEDSQSGFGYDTNKISIFTKKGKEINFPLQTKSEVARLIIQVIANELELL